MRGICDSRRSVGNAPAAALAIVFAVGAIAPAGAADVLVSRTFGKTCKQLGGGESLQTTCIGPANYVSTITNQNQMVTISFGHPDAQSTDHGMEDLGLLWRGVAPFVGSNIEWRLVRGRPFAAIVRIFTIGHDERPRQQFLVAKVTPAGGCEIARIDVSDSNAYGTARDIADSRASNITCEMR